MYFKVYIEAVGAVDTKHLEIYLDCGDCIEEIKSNPNFLPKVYVHKKSFIITLILNFSNYVTLLRLFIRYTFS